MTADESNLPQYQSYGYGLLPLSLGFMADPAQLRIALRRAGQRFLRGKAPSNMLTSPAISRCLINQPTRYTGVARGLKLRHDHGSNY
jgi:hypothetical protein